MIEREIRKFELAAPFGMCGDQPTAVKSLVEGLNDGLRTQVLLGVTGSGKTFSMANVIQQTQRPTLVIAHNKTLAAQLCNEFREFFPKNKVEYFVSYYDYYQPEAYIPRSDTFIEKEMDINQEIDKLRNSATSSLCERSDVIVVASVSCIYGLGAPTEYYTLAVSLRPKMPLSRDELIMRLVEIQYKRSDIDFVRSTFRVRGDIVEIFPANASDFAIRVEFFGDEIEKISEFEIVTKNPVATLEHVNIFPATHYAVERDTLERALAQIGADLVGQVARFKAEGKLIEAERLQQRVSYDMEMMREMGYCSGIENYSRYFDGRAPGQAPYCLFDFFPKDFLLIVDESHMTLPQIRGMYNGDRARKTNLVGYGFRLPSAYDNRPLEFPEFEDKFSQILCVSATPAKYELDRAGNVAEQVIRPTGLLDPEIEIRPIDGQIDDIIAEIHAVVETGGRLLITTLTKKSAESLTAFLGDKRIRVRYMHSDIDTLERIDIITGLRKGDFDVLVGINLLREGLDMPEVKRVLILDADKEGFLRSETSLVQTIGRAARNADGKVIMYADNVTDSMKRAIGETNRRRALQQKFNEENGIVPKTIIKEVVNTLNITHKLTDADEMSVKDIRQEIAKLRSEMKVAASQLDFEGAIQLRERIAALTKKLRD